MLLICFFHQKYIPGLRIPTLNLFQIYCIYLGDIFEGIGYPALTFDVDWIFYCKLGETNSSCICLILDPIECFKVIFSKFFPFNNV